MPRSLVGRRLRAIAVSIAFAAVVSPLQACGSPREYAAARISPPPEVGDLSLPDLTAGGTERRFVAEPDDLLIVYFGYTNCPDFCPQSLSDAAAARNRLDDPFRILVAMVTIDPDRDLGHLADYVQSFFDDGIAMGTDDPVALARAAQPFGVSYSVTPVPPTANSSSTTDQAGATSPDVEVAHTTSLYAVNDAGQLVMTWAYGTSIGDITSDIELYLDSEVDA